MIVFSSANISELNQIDYRLPNFQDQLPLRQTVNNLLTCFRPKNSYLECPCLCENLRCAPLV